MLVLITYDVNTETSAGRKRLRKVAKKCVDHGQRVQNSVFECLLNASQYAVLKAELTALIDPALDSLRFSQLGNNDVVIRASYEGKADSVITHTVYYMPNADIYTRRAWDLDAQYTDLVNYITMRKGTIYMGTGTITRIVSTTPQMAIMNIGNDNFEKLVMLENSSKTTWTVGTKYRIYGEAYGLYDTMPRLTVRYTYLVE